jgi:hypothetical protein
MRSVSAIARFRLRFPIANSPEIIYLDGTYRIGLESIWQPAID